MLFQLPLCVVSVAELVQPLNDLGVSPGSGSCIMMKVVANIFKYLPA